MLHNLHSLYATNKDLQTYRTESDKKKIILERSLIEYRPIGVLSCSLLNLLDNQAWACPKYYFSVKIKKKKLLKYFISLISRVQ